MSGEFPVDRIPAGCKHLYGSLFTVPFAAIKTPDVDEERPDEYKFENPRMLTEKGRSELLDKRLSAELRESIKNCTLLNPLVCRWVPDGDDFVPMLVGGDRRYRAIDFLIRKKELVTDPRSVELDEQGEWVYSECPANEAYEFIPCQVFACNNDIEALVLSWAENKGRINLTDGHEIAEVMKLQSYGASDDIILDVLQQDGKWLSETVNLIEKLDTDTLADLLENRINRASACELMNIEDQEVREKVRIAANESAKEAAGRKIKRFQKEVLSALEKKEIAEGSLADAEFHEDDEAQEEAKAVLESADREVKAKIKKRDSVTPVATAKDVKKAAIANGVDRGDEERPKVLSARKIQKGLDYIDELIANEGQCPNGTFEIELDHLILARKLISNNILGNEADFAQTIVDHLETATV